MSLLVVIALIAAQWFGAASALSRVPTARGSCRTTWHIWLGLLHLHYGHVLPLPLVERGPSGRCLRLPHAGFAAGLLSSPGASVSVSAMHGTESRAETWAWISTRRSGWWRSGSWEAAAVLPWHCMTSNGAVLSLDYRVTRVLAAGGREPASKRGSAWPCWVAPGDCFMLITPFSVSAPQKLLSLLAHSLSLLSLQGAWWVSAALLHMKIRVWGLQSRQAGCPFSTLVVCVTGSCTHFRLGFCHRLPRACCTGWNPVFTKRLFPGHCSCSKWWKDWHIDNTVVTSWEPLFIQAMLVGEKMVQMC